MFILVCAFVLSFTVGYSALNRDLKISGEGVFRVEEDIRITNIELSEIYDAVENYNADYSKNTIKIGATLNSLTSSITYKVSVTNIVNVGMWIDSVEQPINNNTNIEYVIEGIELKESIQPNEVKEFIVRIKYKDGITLPDNKTIDTTIKFNFGKPESVLTSTGLSISEDGIESVSQLYNSPIFNGPVLRSEVESIEFMPTLDVGDNAIGYWDASENKDGSVIAWYTDTDGDSLYELYVGGNGEVYFPENSDFVFSSFYNLEEIDLAYVNTTKVTSMGAMFAANLIEKIDLSLFDTTKVANMSYMFYGAMGKSINVSSFNTSNVTNMDFMFAGASGITELDLSSFNISKVTNMENFIWSCTSLQTLNLSNFDFSDITNFGSLFSLTTNITTLDLSNATLSPLFVPYLSIIDDTATIYVKDEASKQMILDEFPNKNVIINSV